jgi:hypothetical protein
MQLYRHVSPAFAFVCVRMRVRVRLMNVCVGIALCARVRLRVKRMRVCAFALGFARVHVRVRVSVPARCAGTLVARRRLVGINSSACDLRAAARACLRWCDRRAHGRRCYVDEPHTQAAVGCASLPHVRGRRRRRHLRHRRLLLQDGHHHLLPGRVGEHRRRCVAGLRQGGGRMVGGTTGVLHGSSRGTPRYSKALQSTPRVLQGCRGTMGTYYKGSTIVLKECQGCYRVL